MKSTYAAHNLQKLWKFTKKCNQEVVATLKLCRFAYHYTFIKLRFILCFYKQSINRSLIKEEKKKFSKRKQYVLQVLYKSHSSFHNKVWNIFLNVLLNFLWYKQLKITDILKLSLSHEWASHYCFMLWVW